MYLCMKHWLLCTVICLSFTDAVRLSNIALPLDNRSLPLLTGEAHVMQHGNSYYFYFNNWGGGSVLLCSHFERSRGPCHVI
jgi:hypothetical protein